MQVYGGATRYSVEIQEPYRTAKYIWVGFAEDVPNAINTALTLFRSDITDPLTEEYQDKLIITVTKNPWILHFDKELI